MMDHQSDDKDCVEGFSPNDKPEQVLVTVTTTEDLHLAILARNLEVAHQILQTLLMKIDVKEVIELVLYYVKMYLPRFRQFQPDEVWLEAKIAEARKLTALIPANDQLPEFQTSKVFYEDPLARTYLRAVASLWSAVRWKHQSGTFTEYASESIGKIIALITVDAKNWLPQEYISLKPESINRNEIGTRLWLDLANRLDTLIR